MKTKAILCLLAFLYPISSLLAQHTEKEFYFKVYTRLETSNFRTTNGNNLILTEEKGNSFSFGGFSPALSWKRETGNFQEVELSRFIFSTQDEGLFIQNLTSGLREPVRGLRSTTLGLALRYEYNWNLAENQSQFQPYIGITSLLSLESEDVVPKTSASFPTYYFNLSNRILATPRLWYLFGQKFVIDFSVSLPLFEIGWNKIREENPLLPEAQQNFSGQSRIRT